jgi:polyisoprenoid-binding protein YceI
LGILWIAALAVAASNGPERFVVDAAASSLSIRTSRAGLLKFAGHDHDIRASGVTGEVLADPQELGASRVTITVDAARLEVQAGEEPPEDVPEVQERMLGPELLDAGRFPTIVFRSSSAGGRRESSGAFDLEIQGTLSLHGVTRPITLHVKAAIAGDLLTASGEARLRQTDYGLTPVSAVAGTVKVRDEVLVRYTIVAHRALGGP